MENKTPRQAITFLLNQEIHEALSSAAFQLRQSHTAIATAAIVHYLDYLKKTKQYKPSVPKTEGFAVCRR
jgi:hypothetical protein